MAKAKTTPATATEEAVRAALAFMERRGTEKNRDGMARYGIIAARAFGVTVADLRQYGKRLGGNHDLANALWATGWYEARLLAVLIDEPERVTPAQMDAWARDFENWADCDTACFHLFDRTPHAWRKVSSWSRRRDEFVKRAAFALLASLALHDKTTGDEPFLASLALIEGAAADPRNFVKKAVSWALRGIGGRSVALHEAALASAGRLAASDDAAERWVGKDALRDLCRPLVRTRLARREASRVKRAATAARRHRR